MIVRVPTLSRNEPYVGYTYGYPHKSAYRRFDPPVPLAHIWQEEDRRSLFLYLHVPFCEHRCGFCNLFTLANVGADLPAAYLRQLRRQAETIRAALPDARFVRAAIGGGTPTFFDERQLAELLDIAESVFGIDFHAVPASIEASPATLATDKLAMLRERGIERLSLGIQTFDDQQSQRLGRPQRAAEAHSAMARACAAGFPTFNVDLIYGAAGQTIAAWQRDVAAALAHRPTEIYLYPLYVRPLTGLGERAASPADNRLELYRAGRAMLLDAGYVQISMRMFRLAERPLDAGPAYCCQSDGTVGLGCGARSYTRRLHYSTEFAVGRSTVRSILAAYMHRSPGDFALADYGVRLDADDERRRFVLLGLLQAEGLDLVAYRQRFEADACDHLPQLAELIDRDLAQRDSGRLRLTPPGLELSDAIGPWLYAPRIARLMEDRECR